MAGNGMTQRDACDCAEPMDMAFANGARVTGACKLVDYPAKKKGPIVSISLTLRHYQQLIKTS